MTPRTSSFRRVMCGPLCVVASWLGACGPDTASEDSGTSTRGGESGSTTQPGAEGSSGAETGSGGPGQCPADPRFHCTVPYDCKTADPPCGDPASPLDENGCLREDCAGTAKCSNPDDYCYPGRSDFEDDRWCWDQSGQCFCDAGVGDSSTVRYWCVPSSLLDIASPETCLRQTTPEDCYRVLRLRPGSLGACYWERAYVGSAMDAACTDLREGAYCLFAEAWDPDISGEVDDQCPTDLICPDTGSSPNPVFPRYRQLESGAWEVLPTGPYSYPDEYGLSYCRDSLDGTPTPGAPPICDCTCELLPPRCETTGG